MIVSEWSNVHVEAKDNDKVLEHSHFPDPESKA